jgi:hypothetical protein
VGADEIYVMNNSTTAPIPSEDGFKVRWKNTGIGLGANNDALIFEKTDANDADPDGDLLPNLIEWLLASDPEAREPDLRPVFTLQPGDAVFSLTRADDTESIGTLVFQWSTDLEIWNDLPLPAGSTSPDAQGIQITVTENGTSPDSISIMLPRARAPEGRLFTRLRGAAP